MVNGAVEIRYTAFISYSHADAALVARLQRQLENYRIPKALVDQAPAGTALAISPQVIASSGYRLGPMFRDRNELSAAVDLGDSLRGALDQSQYLLVVCSTAAAASPYINQEIRYFQELGRAAQILCVIAGDGEPANVFPEPLRFELDANLQLDRTRPKEPLAADLRPSGDGINGAKLKLAAAMLGVPFDALAQRDQVARAQRLRRIALAASVGMLLMAGLAVYALVQRNAAVHQQQVAQREAARATRVVEFLVGIFKATDPAAENPREVSAVEVLQRGRDRLQHDLDTEPAIKATLQATVADVFTQLGVYPEAEALYDAALGVELLEPLEQAERQLQLATVKFLQRRLDEVIPDIEAVESYIAQVAQTHSQTQPDTQSDTQSEETITSQQVRLLQANASSLRGSWLRYNGEFAGAKQRFESALVLYRTELGDKHERTVREMSNLYSALLGLGEHERALKLIEAVVANDRATVGEQHSRTARSLQHRANLLVQMGQAERAFPDFQAALATLEAILGPTHPETARVHFNLGRTHLVLDQAQAAHDAFVRALAIGQQVHGQVHGFNYQVMLFDAHALAKLNQRDAGLERLDQAQSLAEQIYPAGHQTFGFLLTQRGVVHGEVGEQTAAGSLCQQGVDYLRAIEGISVAIVDIAKSDCARWLPKA